MAGDELTEAQDQSTADGAASGGGSPSAPAGSSPINIQPLGKGRRRADAPTRVLISPTSKTGLAGEADQYSLAGEAEELPSVHSVQNLTRSVRSTSPSAAGPSSAPRATPAADDPARLNKKVLMLSLAVALLAITNAITAYKLYSRSGQAPAEASAQGTGPPVYSDRPASTGHPVAAHPKPVVGVVNAPPAAEPEPELPPSAPATVAEVQEWDPDRFGKARIVEARCSFSGKAATFQTPGCTSFVKFPADALPASLAQTPGDTPDIFRVARAKVSANGGQEPVLNCTMHGGTDIQVRLSKRSGLEEDLLRHSATVLAVAKLGDEEILYVCGLPDRACPSLLVSLSAVPRELIVVPDLGSGGRNPVMVVPYPNPGSLVVKCRKSQKEAWSNIAPPADLMVPRVGKVTFKFGGGPAGKGLTVSTEPDEEFSEQARKCASLPAAPPDGKDASPEQRQLLEIRKIAEECSIRIEDAAGRKLAAFHLVLAIPRNQSQD